MVALTAGTTAYARTLGPASQTRPGAGHLDGPCTVTASIDATGAPIDPAGSDKLTVPIKGSATYSASIAGPTGERAVGGHVEVALPAGLPAITIKSWSDDKAKAVSDSGKVSWDLPSWLPRGIGMRASGVHSDQPQGCSGFMDLTLEGSITDSPAGPASLGFTLLFALGALWSAIPKGQK